MNTPAAPELALPERAGDDDEGAAEPPAHAAPPAATPVRRPWWKRVLLVVLPLAVYGGVTLAYFAPVVQSDRTYMQVDDLQRAYFPWIGVQGLPRGIFPQQDYGNSYFPRQVWLNEELQSGRLPQWNPYTFGGSPFLDTGAGIVFHPVRLALTLTVPPTWVHDLYLMASMALAGLGAHALARQLGARLPGALLAGTAWMLNTTFLAWSQLELMAAIVAALPWALFALRRWHDRGRLGWAAAAGAAAGLMPLGGSIDFTTTAWAACGLYALALSQRGVGWRAAPRERVRWRRLGGPVTFGGLALAIGAPAVLPFVSLAPHVGRVAPSEETFNRYLALAPWRFLRVFWPPDLPISGETMHAMPFVGTAVAGLAVVGLLSRGPRQALGRALILGAFLLVANTVVSETAAAIVPTYRSFVVGRHLFLWNLGVVLLGSAGLDRVLGWVGAGQTAQHRRRSLPVTAVAGTVTVAAVAAVAVNAAQLVDYGRAINPPFQLRHEADLMPVTPAIRALQELDGGVGGGRFLPVEVADRARVMSASIPMAFRLETGAGYESAFLPGPEMTWRIVSGEAPEVVAADPSTFGFFPQFTVGEARADLLARTGITTLYTPPDVTDDPRWADFARDAGGLDLRYEGPDGKVWSMRDPSPRAFVVHRAEVAPDTASAVLRATQADFPWRERVVLSGPNAPAASPVAAPAGGPSEVLDVRHGNDRVVVSVVSDNAGWLVLLDTWAPGWTARVGGERADVVVANGTYRAVALNPGTSTVVFEYRTPGLRAGLAATTAALVGLGIWAVAHAVRARSVRPHKAPDRPDPEPAPVSASPDRLDPGELGP